MSHTATGDNSGDLNPASLASIDLASELLSEASAIVTADAGPKPIGQKREPPIQVESRLGAISSPTLRDYTTEQFNRYEDDYLPRDVYRRRRRHLPRREYLLPEVDEAGDRMVDANGQLLEGREYKCRTFILPNRGHKLFILASECATVMGYLNSHSLFNANRNLEKITASQAEKEDLIRRNIIPSDYRTLQVSIMTAKSIFLQFGSRIVADGRRIRDGYGEVKARREGFGEGDIAGGKRSGAADVKRAAATAWASASASVQGGKMSSSDIVELDSPSKQVMTSLGFKRMVQGYSEQGNDLYQPDLDSKDVLETVKQQILYSLRDTIPEDRKRKRHGFADTIATMTNDLDHPTTPKKFTATFNLRWSLAEFMIEQFSEPSQTLIGSVIALTGSATCAQATTVRDYLKRHWPDTGLLVLEMLQKGLDLDASEHGKLTILEGRLKTKLQFTEAASPPLIEWTCIDASAAEVVEVAQQLAWLGSTCQTSPSGRVGRSNFHMTQQRDIGTGLRFLMEFSVKSLEDEEKSCWHDLFLNPVIASNFPMEERHFGNGLEIPIHMMAALGGASQAVEFEGGIVIKGFSSMFVPLKREGDSIQWHYVRKNDDTRLPYSEVNDHCPGRALLENVDFESLTTTRAFLGWWGNTTSHLGTADANYHNIDWSDTKEPGRPVVLRGASIGFQNFGAGQLDFSAGLKDGKLHISRTGSYQRIVKYASRTPIILYDTSEKRGWLVPSSAVIAHIAQTRHFREGFSISGKPVKFTSTDSSLDIYEGAEKMLLSNSEVKIGQNEFGMGEVFFRDLVLNIWCLIESLIDKDIKMDLTNDIPLNGVLRPNLRGWEFMDVVTERSPIRLKEAHIQRSNGGWMHLAQDLNAVVLFASGFEELIKPAKETGLCRAWQRVPKDKDYLTASVAMLNTLYEEAGSRLTKKHLTSTHLRWHRGAALFETCPNHEEYQCACNRLQQLFHESPTTYRINPPGPLEERGAVIFGGVLSLFGIPNRQIRPNQQIKPSQQRRTSRIYSQENIPFLMDTASTEHTISSQIGNRATAIP